MEHIVFDTESNSHKPVLPYFHHQQVIHAGIYATVELHKVPSQCGHHSVLRNCEKRYTLLWIGNSVLIIFRAQRLQCKKTKFPRFICYHLFSLTYRNCNRTYRCLK